MKRVLTFILIMYSIVMATGCAKFRNSIAADGGALSWVAGGSNGDYIVISQSGGEIMDVWVLPDTMVQSEQGSDGWLFRDNDGNCINIAGDVKVIRIKKQSMLTKYNEYHMEFETQSYREKFGKIK